MTTSTTALDNIRNSKKNLARMAVSRLTYLLDSMYSVKTDDAFKKNVFDFIMASDFYGDIGVLLTKKPLVDNQQTFPAIYPYDVIVSFGKNSLENKQAFILSATVCTRTLELFKRYWENRECPKSLFDGAVKKIDFNRSIYIVIFKSIDVWNEFKKKSKNCINITPKFEECDESPDKPNVAGYIDIQSNSVVIVDPSITKGTLCYTFERDFIKQ